MVLPIKGELTAGTSFGPGGAGHLLLSTEIFHREGIEETVADWAMDGYFAMGYDSSPGQPKLHGSRAD